MTPPPASADPTVRFLSALRCFLLFAFTLAGCSSVVWRANQRSLQGNGTKRGLRLIETYQTSTYRDDSRSDAVRTTFNEEVKDICRLTYPALKTLVSGRSLTRFLEV